MVGILDFCQRLFCIDLIISMRSQVPGNDHVHPDLSVFNQSVLKGFPGGISGTMNRGSLVLKKILHHLPGQLVGVFEGLNQTLFLKQTEFSLFAQEHRIIQLSERNLEIVKALDPANSRISHIFNSSKKETYSICSEFFENIFLYLNIQFAKIEQYPKNQ